MAVPTKKEILDASPVNTGGREDVPDFMRQGSAELEMIVGTGLVAALTGLRRVGKTTLLKQFINSRDDAFYFSFDEEVHTNYDALKRVVEVLVAQADAPLIVLDEIGRIKGWAGLVKRYHDRKQARFVISGSASLDVSKGKESLAGRMMEMVLPPLQFDEFLELKGLPPLAAGRPEDLFASKAPASPVEDFLVKGGFPEIIDFDDDLARRYVRSSTVERIVFEDIPSTFGIKHRSRLYDLLRYVATYSACPFHDIHAGEAVGLNKGTVRDYMLYLERSFLAHVLHEQGSFAKSLRKTKKVFVATPSIYNALSEDPTTGGAAEVAVLDKLMNGLGSPLSFYRDAQGHEVDFIAPLPIEVKYRENITSADTRALRYYMRKKGKDRALVVTKHLFDERDVREGTILYIPLATFLAARVTDPGRFLAA